MNFKSVTKCVCVLWIMLAFMSSLVRAGSSGIDLKGKWDEQSVSTLFIDGNKAYLGCGKKLIILDITNKSVPVKLGEATVTENVVSIFVSGNYAYVVDSTASPGARASSDRGLRILDISNPAQPREVAFYNRMYDEWVRFNIRVVTVSGNYAYLGSGYTEDFYSAGALDILDVSNPESPQFKGAYYCHLLTDIFISGNYAYCANFFQDQYPFTYGGMDIIDISNPKSPRLAGSNRFSGYDSGATGVQVSGTHAFVTNYDRVDGGRIEIIDVSNPGYSMPCWFYSTHGTAQDVFISGDYAYIADGDAGLKVIDITHLHGLTTVAYYDIPTGARNVIAANGYVYVAAGTGGFLIFQVSSSVLNQPWITLVNPQLYFGALKGTSTTSGKQEVFIINSGAGVLNWTAASDVDWLTIKPQSGKGDGMIEIEANPGSLDIGEYYGTVTITDPNASNSPQKIDVFFNVYSPRSVSSPFGAFETPVDNSTVMSSIPVTGWVLDRIGIDSLKIYRVALPGEGSGMVYIGDAVFVEGARPDVSITFPGYPLNSKAGWGYMLLTNFLPNGGNGTFTLYAVATSVTGEQVTLGSKTIVCDNANAEYPFGALDAPTPGGTVSGVDFVNWGWVLAPQPNRIPTDGSRINLYIDGAYIGHPTYNIYRSDIAQLFPGYENSNGAAGHFHLDTTAFRNGTHTIQWTAADDKWHSDGIGSRYFLILNGPEARSKGQMETADTAGGMDGGKDDLLGMRSPDVLSQLPCENTMPVTLQKGFAKDREATDVYPDENGVITIESRELELIEISLTGEKGLTSMSTGMFGGSRTSEGGGFAGYLLVGDELRPLPIGSLLDEGRGIFCWGPGPGFVGLYELVFIDWNQGFLRRVNIKIEPKYSGN